MLAELITKRDNFEIVRDQVASIIALELANQRALATTAHVSEDPWQAHVFIERFNPIEVFLNEAPTYYPVINVTLDSSELIGGDPVKTQQYDLKVSIDCYGCSASSSASAGDQAAAVIAQRAARLCRNILMSPENARLKLTGVVGYRKVQNILSFRPDSPETVLQPVSAVRLSLLIGIIETSAQVTGQPIEIINVDIKRAENGALLVSAQYDLT